jgi:outer membrane protein assembly factor BamB
VSFHSKISARLLLTIASVGLLVAGVFGVAGSPALAGVGTGQAGPNGSSTASLSAAVTTSDWTTFDHDSLRSGVDPSGNSFSPAAPAWTSPTFDGQLYGQPLVATGRVFAATENDTVYALAADTGAVLWSNHLGTPLNPSTVPGLCGDIHPTVGITGTPVIDAARSEIFVVATLSAGSNAAHQLIGLDIYTGTVLLNENIDPPGANPAFQLQRVSLALTDGRVIVGFGGNSGDCDPYHGLVVSAPEDGSAPSTYTVANLPGDSQGAVWMGGAAPSVDAQGNVWVATGNSAFHSASDTYDQSDSVLKLSPTMQLLDSFAPQLWYNDNAGDADLGSTTPALLPNGLVFEVGKSTTAYVLNQSSLGGVNGQVALRNSFCFADGGSADLNGTLFVPCSNGIEAVTPTASAPTATWTTSSGVHGSPIVAGGLVWSIGSGTLYALNAATGAEVQHFAIGASSSSFPSPSAADGLILAPSSTQIHAFVGPAGLPPPPPPPPPSTSVLIPSNGATVSGSTLLDASASNATSVEFQLFGGVYGFFGPVVCTATPTYYGWLCSWNTTTVPNGSYVLSSLAFNSTGSAYSMGGVNITVSNPPTTSVLIPSNGATLTGSSLLDASASNATSVEFRLFGGSFGFNAPVICTATPTYYGWLCSWNTTTVPNGSYVLLSEAFNSTGSAYSMGGVNITVSN